MNESPSVTADPSLRSAGVTVDAPERSVYVTVLLRASTIAFGVLIGAVVGLVTAFATGLLTFSC